MMCLCARPTIYGSADRRAALRHYRACWRMIDLQELSFIRQLLKVSHGLKYSDYEIIRNLSYFQRVFINIKDKTTLGKTPRDIHMLLTSIFFL